MKQHLWFLLRRQPKLSASQWITLEPTVPECHLQWTCKREKSICYATRYSIIVYVSGRTRVTRRGVEAGFATEGRRLHTLLIPHQMSKHNDLPRLAEVTEIRPFKLLSYLSIQNTDVHETNDASGVILALAFQCHRSSEQT